MRNSIKLETLRALLARTGNQCAFEGCNHPLFNDDNLFIAQLAHIEAVSPNGPRYNSNQTDEERNNYENLLFLCYRHHKEIDNTENYTVDSLKEIKTNHEKKFKESNFSIPENILNSTLKEIENYWTEIGYINRYEHVIDDFKVVINTNAQFDELFQFIQENLSDISTSISYINEETEYKYFETLCLRIPNSITRSYVVLKQLEIKVYEQLLLNDINDLGLKRKLDTLKTEFREIATRAGIAD